MITDDNIQIRTLTAEDTEVYKPLRLRSQKEHPEAYYSAYEDSLELTPEEWQKRVTPSERWSLFGAFDGLTLVGITGVMREMARKANHRAMIVQVYTLPDYRGRGIARRLLDHSLNYIKSLDGVSHVTLAVTVGNDTARRIYAGGGVRDVWH